MRTYIVSHSFLIAAMAFVPAAFAGEAIVKCVDTAGHVTLTDEPCPQSSQAVRTVPSAARQHYVFASAELPRAHRSAGAALPRKPSPDVATLKAARLNMQLAESMRQQRLAGLN
jgi:hypothetical protein